MKDPEPIDSSRRAQNRAALVGSGEHPGLRCPRTKFADRRRLPSSTRTIDLACSGANRNLRPDRSDGAI